MLPLFIEQQHSFCGAHTFHLACRHFSYDPDSRARIDFLHDYPHLWRRRDGCFCPAPRTAALMPGRSAPLSCTRLSRLCFTPCCSILPKASPCSSDDSVRSMPLHYKRNAAGTAGRAQEDTMKQPSVWLHSRRVTPCFRHQLCHLMFLLKFHYIPCNV